MDISPVLIIPVIVAGGSGARLWPLSRERLPKQLLSITGKSSLFQKAFLCGGLFPPVVTSEVHRFLVAEQIRQMYRDASILLELVGRNTVPAIALAAFQAMKSSVKDDRAEAALLLVLDADYVIEDTAAFEAAIKALEPEVRAGKFGTLGIASQFLALLTNFIFIELFILTLGVVVGVVLGYYSYAFLIFVVLVWRFLDVSFSNGFFCLKSDARALIRPDINLLILYRLDGFYNIKLF
jgi:hypothetical protein